MLVLILKFIEKTYSIVIWLICVITLVVIEALKEMDEFYVIIYDTPLFNIEIDTKVKWIKKEITEVKILKVFNIPKQYRLDKERINIQM